MARSATSCGYSDSARLRQCRAGTPPANLTCNFPHTGERMGTINLDPKLEARRAGTGPRSAACRARVRQYTGGDVGPRFPRRVHDHARWLHRVLVEQHGRRGHRHQRGGLVQPMTGPRGERCSKGVWVALLVGVLSGGFLAARLFVGGAIGLSDQGDGTRLLCSLGVREGNPFNASETDHVYLTWYPHHWYGEACGAIGSGEPYNSSQLWILHVAKWLTPILGLPGGSTCGRSASCSACWSAWPSAACTSCCRDRSGGDCWPSPSPCWWWPMARSPATSSRRTANRPLW